MDVDPVEKWAGDALLVFGDQGGGTGTRFKRVAVIASRAGVHGGDQLEIGRKSERTLARLMVTMKFAIRMFSSVIDPNWCVVEGQYDVGKNLHFWQPRTYCAPLYEIWLNR